MHQYLELINDVLIFGDEVQGRNGKAIELFGATTCYRDLETNFPVVTTKKMPIRTIIAELLCFIRGYTHLSDFKKMGVNFWDANTNSDYWKEKQGADYMSGYMGRIYGAQWRNWRGIETDLNGDFVEQVKYHDQLKQLIYNLKTDPNSRRHIVTAWNPGEIDFMCLPPCHMFFQVNITSDNKLDLIMYQRSCDLFLGVPFNITSYCILMLILCHQTGYKMGTFTHMMGNVHIYEDHIEQCKTLLNRVPLALPQISINKKEGCELEDYEVTDFIINNYTSYDKLEGKMSV